MRIGLDIMGGDFTSRATMRGAVLAVDVNDTSCRLVLIGDVPSIIEAQEIVHLDQQKK